MPDLQLAAVCLLVIFIGFCHIFMSIRAAAKPTNKYECTLKMPLAYCLI